MVSFTARSSYILVLLCVLHPLLLNNCHGFAAKKARSSTTPAKGFGTASKTVTTYTPEDSPQNTAFLEFVASQKGTRIQNVEIGIDKATGRRGLYTTKTFGKDDALICKVPSDCALALSDPEAVQQEDAPPTTMPERGLAFLQRYAGKKDWFTPYLDILPSQITTRTPNLWSEEEIKLLEFPRLVKQAEARKAEINQLAQSNGIDVSELEYATWLVSSRAFPIRISQDGEEEAQYDERGQVLTKAGTGKFVPVLVPVLDMANHGVKPNAKLTLIDPEKDEAFFALTTTRPVKAGQEITLAYGSGVDSSVELVLNYGFVCMGNPIDAFMLEKGGEDCIASLDGWTTTLQEDQSVLGMLEQTSTADDEESPENDVLKTVMSFRIQLKGSYKADEEA